MKDDSTEISARRRYFRYAVFSLTALLVLSLGMALIPRQAPQPAEPPFSERARAAALSEAMALRAAVQELAAAADVGAAPGGSTALQPVVTLLTIQARALMLPGGPTDSAARPEEGQHGIPDPAGTATAPSGSPAAPGPASAAELASKLSASGAQRLTDALQADGGMARLLAGAGTAQVLAAENLAAVAGLPADKLPGWQVPAATETSAECATAVPSGVVVGLAGALTVAVDAERETVYGYQAALTRLDPASAARASDHLAQHADLVEAAEEHAARHCAIVPPRQPGYVLDAAFLDSPGAGLARLEAGSLAVYGDVVALSSASTRSWAVATLVAAARRTTSWGGDPGPVPGIALDLNQLPVLPAGTLPTASPAGS